MKFNLQLSIPLTVMVRIYMLWIRGQRDNGYQALMGPLTTLESLLLLKGIIMNCPMLNHVYWKEYEYLTARGMFFLVWWWFMLSNKMSDFWNVWLLKTLALKAAIQGTVYLECNYLTIVCTTCFWCKTSSIVVIYGNKLGITWNKC